MRRKKVVRHKLSKPLDDKKVIKIPKQTATKYPPLTSENELKRSRKEQNALNRQRSKSMETRVAKVLRGRRVLLSGAASAYKGDVEVRFDNYPGGYIAECKLSAQSKRDGPHIKLQFYWFPKIHEEAKNMGSKFGVLIVNFLGNTRDYVFIRKDVAKLLIHRYHTPYVDTLSKLLVDTTLLDLRTNTHGKTLIGYTLTRVMLETNMISIDGMNGVRVLIPDGEYLIIHIDTWAKMVAHM